MKRHVAFISIIFLGVVMLACSAKLSTFTKEACVTPPNDALIAVIKDKCNLCHAKDFPSREEICSRKGLIQESVKSGAMPKFGSLSPAEKSLILDWN